MTDIAEEHDGSLRVDWKQQARLALRRGDPWAAWAEIRNAPEDETTHLRNDLLRLIAKRIAKTRDIDALGDLFRLAVDTGTLGAGYGPDIKNTTRTLTDICEDEALSADAVLTAIYPLADAKNIENQVLEVLLDVIEIVSVRATSANTQALILALLSSCRQRDYAGVQVGTLERMIELAETYA